MNSKQLSIYKKISKPQYFSTISAGLVGGVLVSSVTNLSVLSYLPTIGYFMGLKFILIGLGASLGWNIGGFLGQKTFEQLVISDDIWSNIYTKYLDQGLKKEEFNSSKILEILKDTRTELAQLYIFCNIVFSERYEKMDIDILKELRQITQVITKLHPMISKQYFPRIYEIIERKVFYDYYPYLQDYYANINRIKYYEYYDSSPIFFQYKNTLSMNDASYLFKLLLDHCHPKDKITILITMVKKIADEQESLGNVVSCDELIPLITEILKENIDSFPGVQLEMIYDYLGHGLGEEAYISTVLLSSFQNLTEQKCLNQKKEEFVSY